MKKRDHRTLAAYVRTCADLLELRDWTVVVGDPLPDDSSFATMHLDRAEQRATVAHELIHCHFEPAWAMVRDDLDRHVGQHLGWAFYDGWRRSMEYGIEAMTQAVVDRLPLIDWP